MKNGHNYQNSQAVRKKAMPQNKSNEVNPNVKNVNGKEDGLQCKGSPHNILHSCASENQTVNYCPL
jgi:hypothetical protein